MKPDYAFRMGVGGFVFDIQPLYSTTKYLCRDYLLPDSEAAPDAVIAITREELAAEKKLSPEKEMLDVSFPPKAAGAYCERSALLRRIADFAAARDAVVFHGVLLELAGEGYLFTARSGTGKTTHALNWLKAFPEARIINGDKPILRIEGGRLMGYGTPWCGKEDLHINTKVPVKAVILVERAEKNSIEQRAAIDMLPTWLVQAHQPRDPEAREKFIDTALAMIDLVSLFCLRCNQDPGSALVARQGIDRAAEDGSRLI